MWVKYYVENYVTKEQAIDQKEDLENWTFDQWQKLHEQDSDLFEKTRQQLFTRLVHKAPTQQQQRLKGLLFTLEGEKRRSRSIAAEQARYLALMMDNLADLNEQLSSILERKPTNNPEQSQSATLLTFDNKKNQQ